MSSAGLSVVKQGGNLKERQEKKRKKKLGEQSGARMEWMESSEGGMSERKVTEEGKAEGEGKQETQETLWEDKERLAM